MKIDSAALGNLTGTYQSALTSQQETIDTDAFKKTLEQAASDKDLEKLKVASQEFEAYFVNTLFKEMRKTIQDGGLTEKSQARETFEGMLDEEMSKLIGKKGGFGIADLIYENMSRIYGNQKIETESIDADSILDQIGIKPEFSDEE